MGETRYKFLQMFGETSLNKKVFKWQHRDSNLQSFSS